MTILSNPVWAIRPPWADTREPSTPWGSSERREAREGFFKGLQLASREPSLPIRTETEDQVVSDVPDQSDLSEIPWDDHKKSYPKESFNERLLWPVEGGRLTSGYGFRQGRVHEGIDLAASSGTGIRAVAAGVVVYSGMIKGYGRLLVVYHGSGISSVYAHNSKNLKNRGDRVRQGEVIGRVGTSGETSGPHCHFEIRENGKATNPLRFSYMKSPLYAQR